MGYAVRRRPLVTQVAVISLFSHSAGQQIHRQLMPRGSVTYGAPSPPVAGDNKPIEAFQNTFTGIAEKVIPSIVSIIPTRIDTDRFNKNPLYRLFPDDSTSPFTYSKAERGRIHGGIPGVNGYGCGIVASDKGHILTDYTVVIGVRELEIRFFDGRIFPAVIVGVDHLSNIAIIKIIGDMPKEIPIACLGNSDSVRAGEWVASTGIAFNSAPVIATGIVTTVGCKVSDEPMHQNFFQTNTSFTPGGALVRLDGSVAGIHIFPVPKPTLSSGASIILPVNTAKRVLSDIVHEGKVMRPWIGISVQSVTPELRSAFGLHSLQGVVVETVWQGQPADRAGIGTGDVILSFAGKELHTPNDLYTAIAALFPGHRVPVTLIKDNRLLEISIKTGEYDQQFSTKQAPVRRQPCPQRTIVTNKVEIGVEEISTQSYEKYGIPRNATGVIVTAIGLGVHDARTMLKPGDIIAKTKVEGKDWIKYDSERDFEQVVNELKPGQSLVLQVVRNNQAFLVPFKVN